MIGLYGSSENFLKHGLGYVLWDNEQQLIVCESYGIHTQKWMELGSITRENYRGQGLSTILCNHIIRKSIEMGLMPVWTCEIANIASCKIAENNGMNEIIEYSFSVWKRSA